MKRLVYKVRCLVEKDVAEKWIQFFLDKHLADVLNTGYFTNCSFYEIETNSKLTRTFCSEFFYNSPEDLEAYNKHSAPALKADTKNKFGDKFSCHRELMTELGALEQAKVSM